MKGRKTGGRREGTPNKVTVEAREAAAALVDDPVYRAKLIRDLRQRKVAAAIEQMLWYYAKGKPRETVDLNTGLFMVNPEVVAKLSDEELELALRLTKKLDQR
jgi:hypothetical protein